MDKKLIARVSGIPGNVTIRGFVKVATGRDVAAVSTTDGAILYVDTKMVEILEVRE